MSILLSTLVVVLLGSCVLASDHSESSGNVESKLDTDVAYKTYNIDVDAVLEDLGIPSIHDKPEALGVVNKKREIQDTKSSVIRSRNKKSTSSNLLDDDAEECNAKPHPLTDDDKQKLLIEVLNAGPSAQGEHLDKELFSFVNHHGCVASRQTSTSSCEGDDDVKVLQVDAGGKELVNESLHFENNRPTSVEVETADRIVVHDLGSPSTLKEDRGAEQSKDLHLLKILGGSQETTNGTTQEHVDVTPGNTQPLTLDAWVNQPSSLRKSVKASCVSSTDAKKECNVHCEVQPKPRQGVHPKTNEMLDTSHVNSVSDVARKPSNPSLLDATTNMKQYRLAPWGAVDPQRLNALNAADPANKLLSPFVTKNLVMSPDVASSKAAPVEGDPAKRDDADDKVTLIVVQPEVISLSLPEPRPIILLPETVNADRHYVLVPAEDLLVAAPEASKDCEATRPEEAEMVEKKYSYAKTDRRPEQAHLVNERPANCGSSKKAVQAMSPSRERLVSKCHDADAARDIFNVNAASGSVGTCCGPDCHCTCNLGPERQSAAAALLPSAASRRNYVAGSKALGRTLESPQSLVQERRWPARKLTRGKSNIGQDLSRVEPTMLKSLDGHPYLKGMQIERGDSTMPRRVVASKRSDSGGSRRTPIKRQFDGNIRKMAPFAGRHPQVHEHSAGAWDVYQDMLVPRYKRDDEDEDE